MLGADCSAGAASARRWIGLLRSVRSGQSRVLVLRGEAGIGKTALLEYVVERASGWRIARAAGVESEMELPFAGLHQLCAPMLDGLDAAARPATGRAARSPSGCRTAPPRITSSSAWRC